VSYISAMRTLLLAVLVSAPLWAQSSDTGNWLPKECVTDFEAVCPGITIKDFIPPCMQDAMMSGKLSMSCQRAMMEAYPPGSQTKPPASPPQDSKSQSG
jgi:hypothetical protein